MSCKCNIIERKACLSGTDEHPPDGTQENNDRNEVMRMLRDHDAGEMTRMMYKMATSGELSLKQAAWQLRQDAHVRCVRETLEAFVHTPPGDVKALQARLVEALAQADPAANRASIERKVRMWMKDDARSITKEGAILLAFALELSLEEAQNMLTRLCEEGFHWRNPQEIVYLYALSHGMRYPDAVAMQARLAAKGLLSPPRTEETTLYTGGIRQRVQTLSSEAELEAFLRDAHGELGKMHNTAYSLFMSFLDLLGLPRLNDNLPDPAQLSVRAIMATYLHNNFIPRVRRATKGDTQQEEIVLGALQRDIRANWPDEVQLSRMIHREADVTRKVLILLFLATDGGESPYGDLTDQTPDDLFADMYERMNSMLNDCGFSPLDSRTPFDWMVLYCMCADESMFIDGRMQRFLREVFPAGDSEPELAERNDGARK